jgi:hypothetical protein
MDLSAKAALVNDAERKYLDEVFDCLPDSMSDFLADYLRRLAPAPATCIVEAARPFGRPELDMPEFTEAVFNWVDEDLGVDREENENEPLSAASLLLDLGKYGMSVVPNEWLCDLEAHLAAALNTLNLHNAPAARVSSSLGGEAGGAEAFGFIKVGDPEDSEAPDWKHESQDAPAMCLFPNGGRMLGWYQQDDSKQEYITGHWCWRESDGDRDVYWSAFTPQPTHFLPELGKPHMSHAS